MYEVYFPSFALESMELIIRPRHGSAMIEPTNARVDAYRKKNLTPKPISIPPPIAHVLLLSFLFALSI